MDCTNCGNECAFVKSGFCQTDKGCPFYLESWWHLEGAQDPKLIKDCFPKKFGVEQNHLLHRFLGLQKAVEQLRNNISRLENIISILIDRDEDLHPNNLKMSKDPLRLNNEESKKGIE